MNKKLGIRDLELVWGCRFKKHCSAVVRALRCKSSFRCAALWAFHFNPAAIRHLVKNCQTELVEVGGLKTI